MTDLYLIAHKVRNEPAFDVAVRMRCPICEPMRQGLDDGSAPFGCDECDGEGYWWIIPTSGHRAYPWRSTELGEATNGWPYEDISMPPDLPDHYPTSASPSRPALDLSALIPKSAPIRRRV